MSKKTIMKVTVKTQGDVIKQIRHAAHDADWAVAGGLLQRHSERFNGVDEIRYEGESLPFLISLIHLVITEQKATVKKQRNAKKPIGRGRGR